ncbi:MAG: hypothetical protein ACOYK6_00785 [Chthoniobacterales bacterium]
MPKTYSTILFLMMALAAVVWPVYFADQFFLALWPSLLWAVAIGIASASRGWRGLLLTGLLSLLPLVAGIIYFGVSHASNESFLCAGLIPWSDAAMHFRQAAQMAVYGITQTGMNGRFLYPAYFSSLLTMSNDNLLVAEALSGLLFAGSLIVALRTTARFIGAVGASIVALVCWLFFRSHCSGLIMTENLGIICGLLSLTALLIATKRHHFWLLLLGIFMLALGLCARPGALVVLPLLVLFAGWVGWNGWLRGPSHRMFQALIAATLSLLVVLMAFGCNTLLARTLYEGKVITNQNFAFTLYGMLTGGTWFDSYTWSHGDAPLVMQKSLTLIREKPELLLFGAARAYKTALYRRTLFMFHHESRPATLLLIMAGLGLVALWKKEELKPYALWITLMAAGILLSIPFAPPWDAAERPFAATLPFQGLLAGIGLFSLWHYFFASKMRIAVNQTETKSYTLFCTLLLAALIFFLTVPFPLLHQKFMKSPINVDATALAGLRAGSFVVVSPEKRANLRSRMSSFFGNYPTEAEIFSCAPGPFILGINWNSKNFDRTLLLDPVGETVSFQGWQVDKRLLPHP